MPNQFGGRENLEAIEFLAQLNTLTHAEQPGSITIAEESTAWPAVSRPTYVGGLGFTYKWNMGWMNDILEYIARGSGPPPLGSPPPDVLAALRVHRELHPAVLARRGRARQGVDARQDAGRRLAEGRHAARALRLHVRASRQEADVHGLRVRAVARVELRPQPRLAPARRAAARGHCARSCATSTAPTPRSRRCTRSISTPPGFSGSTATTTRTAWSRSSAARSDPRDFLVAVVNFTPVPRDGYRIGVPAGGPTASCSTATATCTAAATWATAASSSPSRSRRTATPSRSASRCRRSGFCCSSRVALRARRDKNWPVANGQ